MNRQHSSGVAPAKIDADAISVRAMSAGCFTWLCDAEHREQFKTHGPDFFRCLCDCFEDGRPTSYRYADQPKSNPPPAAWDELCRYHASGLLVAIHHDPEIIDSDGVPGIDLLVTRTPRQRPPQVGTWYHPGHAPMDLPSGRLVITYDHALYGEEEDDEEYETAIVELPPGFYQLTVFTRVFETEFEAPPKTQAPDLAIFLTKSEKPTRPSPITMPLIPIHPTDEDVRQYRRELGV